MKVMLLAAGRGERLRPLTERIPKPLVEVAGKPLIVWHLERLAAGGFREIVINVSHLAETIIERLGDGRRFGVTIRYSSEGEPLETAGGIAQALPHLGAPAFLLVNSDIYCEVDFAAFAKAPLAGRLAHLVLVPNPPHRPQGDFSLAARSVGNTGEPRYTYAGVAVLSPQLLSGVRQGEKVPLAPLLRQAADRGMISGELYTGLWQDVGTLERLRELESTLAARR